VIKPIPGYAWKIMPTKILKPVYMLLLVIAFTAATVLAGCGRKGDLVLPDENQKPIIQKTNDQKTRDQKNIDQKTTNQENTKEKSTAVPAGH
jgi:predicted small lipoprotein YifL